MNNQMSGVSNSKHTITRIFFAFESTQLERKFVRESMSRSFSEPKYDQLGTGWEYIT